MQPMDANQFQNISGIILDILPTTRMRYWPRKCGGFWKDKVVECWMIILILDIYIPVNCMSKIVMGHGSILYSSSSLHILLSIYSVTMLLHVRQGFWSQPNYFPITSSLRDVSNLLFWLVLPLQPIFPQGARSQTKSHQQTWPKPPIAHLSSPTEPNVHIPQTFWFQSYVTILEPIDKPSPLV